MFDVEKFVYKHFDEVEMYGNPVSDLRVNCPFCLTRYGSEDYKMKLHISLGNEFCHCFRCGYSRNWIGLVMDHLNVPYHLALGELYVVPRMVDYHKKIEKKEVLKSEDASLPDGFELLGSSRSTNNLLCCSYMRKRSFGKRYWKRYNLGVSEELPYRVIIPIEDEYWQARAIFSHMKPKYMNPVSQSRHYIFNSVALLLYEEVSIAEGAFSSMAVGENCIGFIGKGLIPEKIERLKDRKGKIKKFNVAFDADAYKDAMELANILYKYGFDVDIWKYNIGDPAENDGIISKRGYNFRDFVRSKL